MSFLKKKPEKKEVCCECNTAKTKLIPIVEFSVYSDEAKWYCLSCFGNIVFNAYLDSVGITGYKEYRGRIFTDNLKFLDIENLERKLERLEKRIEELRNREF